MQATPAKSSVTAIVGASIAAIGASVCCVVPLVLVFMGISGAWISTLTALDPLRPWFSAAAVVSLAVAFWLLYRPASHCGRSEVHTSELQSLLRISFAVYC